MTAFGAQAYKKVSVDTGVSSGDPHQLILMLYDGAIAATHAAIGHLQAGRVADKGAAVGKALRIIEEGLKASLDTKAGGQLAFRLSDLYDYMLMRLLQGNLRNDPDALQEVIKLMNDLRGAWAQIKPASAAAPVAAPATSTSAQAMTPIQEPAALAAAPRVTGGAGTGYGNLGAPRRVAISA